MSYKVLFISGSFGLGHVNRDLAIANEMRRICPEIEIRWLAGSPACEVLAAAGEAFASEQAAYRGETELADFNLPQWSSQPHCLCIPSDDILDAQCPCQRDCRIPRRI